LFEDGIGNQIRMTGGLFGEIVEHLMHDGLWAPLLGFGSVHILSEDHIEYFERWNA
jgi:hypothetical protein